MRPSALGVNFLLASLLVTSGASALGAPDRVDVTWAAPRECPSSVDLQERVTARLPGASAVRARGRVERVSSSTWRLELAIETPSSRGERTLKAPTCEALASSAAVVIAMSIAPLPEAPIEAPPAPERAPEQSAAAPRSESTARILVRGHLIGDTGTLPSAALGGGLGFGVRVVQDLSLEGTANLFAAQDATVDGTTRGASFTLLSAGLRACWSLTRRLELAPCLGVTVDRLSATGFGAARVADASSLTWSPEALLALGIPIARHLAVRAGLGAQAPMSRQSFVINAAGTVHRSDAIVLRAWLGPEVRF